MQLVYHEDANFEDALNPLILYYFLPNFFDSNKDIKFLGIGSRLSTLKLFFKTIKNKKRLSK